MPPSSNVPTAGLSGSLRLPVAGKKGETGKGGAPRPARPPRAFRRPPESGWALRRYQLAATWERGLELHWLWIGLFVVVATWCVLPRRLFSVERVAEGDVAPRTYVADQLISLPDEEATRGVQAAAGERVLPVYDFDRGAEDERRRAFAALFAAGREVLARAATAAPETPVLHGAALAGTLAAACGLPLGAAQADLLASRGFSADDEERLAEVLSQVLRRGVVTNKPLLLEHRVRGITVRALPSGERSVELDLYGYLAYPDEVAEAVEQEVRGWQGFSGRERSQLAALLTAAITPNLTPNGSETQRLRQLAVTEAGTVLHTLRRGEVIVRRGDVVDAMSARAIAVMAGSRDVGALVASTAGTLLFLLGVTYLVWLRVGQQATPDRSRRRLLGECLFLFLLHVVGVRFGYTVAAALATAFQRDLAASAGGIVYAIPFATLAMVTVLIHGRTTAGVLSVVSALVVGRIAGDANGWSMTVFALAGSLAAIHAFDRSQFRQRSASNRAGVVVGAASAVTVVALDALSGDPSALPQLGFAAGCAFMGGLLAAATTSFAVPLLEALLGVTTYIKLIELSNPNLPLLRRLALEAPGSFQHSLAVANLAKAGVEAIDGDSLLVHTCALYHDVGKLMRPQYFIENQLGGQNPHDRVQPSMSALIISNHVKEGIDLALRHRLPRPILDAIEQHHGTRLITFFLQKAKERADPETEEIRDDDFRYPGPKPQSKEMGVLMLADSVEAASRTLVEPSRPKLRAVVKAIFDDALQDGQLEETDLTLSDLHQVEDAFLRVLTNVYHRRVDYPGFDFNRGTGELKRKREGTGQLVVPEALRERRRAS